MNCRRWRTAEVRVRREVTSTDPTLHSSSDTHKHMKNTMEKHLHKTSTFHSLRYRHGTTWGHQDSAAAGHGSVNWAYGHYPQGSTWGREGGGYWEHDILVINEDRTVDNITGSPLGPEHNAFKRVVNKDDNITGFPSDERMIGFKSWVMRMKLWTISLALL